MVKKYKNLPLVLLVLDGWGLAEPNRGNAITIAKTPVFDELQKKYPNTVLCAHGDCVGLPDNQDGNSEAGHMNIGAGRIVSQDSIYIAKSISDGTFFNNHVLNRAVEHVKNNKSKLHIIGLLSNGESAHSSPDHLVALLTLMHQKKVDTFLHFFTDGRDSPQYLAKDLIKKVKFYLRKEQKIATLMGRFYAMDRKKKWERTKLAYEALTEGRGLLFNSPTEAIVSAYNSGKSDEFIEPSVIVDKQSKNKKPVTKINDNDAIIFYNLRSDRARELTKSFVQKDFIGFKRKKILKNIFFVAMTDFGPDLPNVATAFPSRDLKGTLPMALKNFRQIYMSESEKYAHVTYFFNGGYDKPVAGEERFNILSPDIDNYADVPEMKVKELSKKIIYFVKKNKYDIIVCNFANPDMVGHTGDLSAGVRAIQSVDRVLGDIKKVILDCNGTLLITADHGNVEEMIDLETGEVDTAHSKNLVPFVVISKTNKIKLKKRGVLGDIAPTILNMLDIKKPEEMTGKSLII